MLTGAVTARPSLARARGPIALAVLVALVVGCQAGLGPSEGVRKHTVRRGETLSRVARRYGVTTASLAQANAIANPDKVRAGDRLVIPPRGQRGSARSVTPRAPAELLLHPDRLALMPVFDAAAKEFGVPPDLLKAVGWQESGWQNHKVSPVNARGIGQLMPATIVFVNERLLRARLDPARPDHNVRMSARFLAYLLGHGNGDPGFALAAYYQGLTSLRREGPKPHTHAYVASVLALRQKFERPKSDFFHGNPRAPAPF